MRHSSRSCATPVGTILRLGVGAVALCAVLPALAEVGPYVGLEAGFSINPRMPLTQSSTLTTTTSSGSITSSGTAHGDVDMSNGAVGGATFGYALPGHLRPELEVNYRRNTAKDTGTGVSAIAVMGNVWYDFEQNHSYFYMGGGIGDLHLHMTVDDHGDTSDAFGGQLGAGAGFFITPQLSVGVDYRYATAFARSDFKFGESIATSSGTATGTLRERIRYRSQTVMLSFRYSFGNRWNPLGHIQANGSTVNPPSATPVHIVPVQNGVDDGSGYGARP